MGKRLNQASLKISKDDDDHHKKQLNNLIKFLKPKVYITSPSSFKSLVQELTGNRSRPLGLLTPTLGPTPDQKIINLPELSENSNDNPVIIDSKSSGRLLDDSLSDEILLDYNCWGDCNYDHDQLSIFMKEDRHDHDQDGMDLFAYGNLESWLLDMNDSSTSSSPSSFYGINDLCAGSVPEQEVDIYDYELSGLI